MRTGSATRGGDRAGPKERGRGRPGPPGSTTELGNGVHLPKRCRHKASLRRMHRLIIVVPATCGIDRHVVGTAPGRPGPVKPSLRDREKIHLSLCPCRLLFARPRIRPFAAPGDGFTIMNDHVHQPGNLPEGESPGSRNRATRSRLWASKAVAQRPPSLQPEEGGGYGVHQKVSSDLRVWFAVAAWSRRKGCMRFAGFGRRHRRPHAVPAMRPAPEGEPEKAGESFPVGSTLHSPPLGDRREGVGGRYSL